MNKFPHSYIQWNYLQNLLPWLDIQFDGLPYATLSLQIFQVCISMQLYAGLQHQLVYRYKPCLFRLNHTHTLQLSSSATFCFNSFVSSASLLPLLLQLFFFSLCLVAISSAPPLPSPLPSMTTFPTNPNYDTTT